MSNQNLLKLTNDYIFKRTFGYTGDEKITRVFLRDILQTDITEITLDNATITEKELIDDKVGIMDIKAVLNGTIQCDIEMQVVNQDDIEKRIIFYWGKMYTQSIKKGDGYGTLPKTISVLIADFELDNLKDIKKYITKWNIREEEYKSIILTDTLEIYIIELPKFIKYTQDKKLDNMNLWVNFIRNPEVIVMTDENDNKSIKETKTAVNEAQEKLRKLSQDKHERELADLREKYIRDQYSIEKYGYKKGREDGMQEGKRQKAIEVAKKMLSEKVDIKIIEKVTELTKEELEQLKNEI